MDSILTTIKKMLGIESDYLAFDTDIIVNINSALMALNQLGVGPATGFMITDSTATWTQFVGTVINLEAVKTYIYLKVKVVFDPPSSPSALDSLNRQLEEYAWRLMVQVDPPLPTVEIPVDETN